MMTDEELLIYLKERYRFDDELNTFVRIKTESGNKAGAIIKYDRITIKNKTYLIKNLKILFKTGKYFSNKNEGGRKKNKISVTGYKGVSFDKRVKSQKKPYRAYIGINRKGKHLGSFETPGQAHEAYLNALERINIYGEL